MRIAIDMEVKLLLTETSDGCRDLHRDVRIEEVGIDADVTIAVRLSIGRAESGLAMGTDAR
jgi:hypothetical protein